MNEKGTDDPKYHKPIIERMLAIGWRFGKESAEFPNPNPADGNFTADKAVYFKDGQQMSYERYKSEYDEIRAEIRKENPF